MSVAIDGETSKMTDTRRQVLDLLAGGKISVEEADRLLGALGDSGLAEGASQRPTAAPFKYMRILVEGLDRKDSPVKVNIRVPLLLLRAGVRLASVIPPLAQARVNAALREQGVQFDISQLRPENVDELIEQLRDLTVDVYQEKEKVRVRIFCE